MKAFLPLAFLAFAVGLVSGQGYYGGDSGGQVQQQPAQQQISSLPQYEGSSGTNDENYWWLKDNPFQKPPNHPGVVKSDERSSGARPSQTYSSQSQPRAQSPPSPALNAKPTPKQAPKKEFKYRPITASYGPGPTSDPEDNPCMLRVKSDCHASGSSPPTPSLNVAEQVPYSSNTYSGNNVQQNVPSQEPANYLIDPSSSQSPSPSLSNQYSNFGPTGNSYNAQQQRPQYNQQPSYNQQSIGQQYNQVQNYEEQPPYPGCPAAMLCVPDDWCNATGYSEGRPLSLSPAAKSFRVAVMACTNVDTNEVGICCRDPDYKDPWPGQNGDGGHEHHQEPKPQVQQQQYQQPQQQQQQQYKPQQQQYQPPAQAPQQPQQQNAYSASQSSRPQAPQQQPSYGSAGQSYSPQPQRQPQPSYNPTYQQPQQPQKSPFSSVSQTYQPQPQQQQQPSYGARPQPQPQQPSYGARPQSQPQQPTYGAQPQTQQQPTYGAQTYSQQPQQQSQKPQQTSYADAGAGGPSPNPYADASLTASSSSHAQDNHFPFSSNTKKKQPPLSPSLIHGEGIPVDFQPESRLSENPYQAQPIYIVTMPPGTDIDPTSQYQQQQESAPLNEGSQAAENSSETPVEPPSQNYELPIFDYQTPQFSPTSDTSSTALNNEDSMHLEPDTPPSMIILTKQPDDDLETVSVPSQDHDSPQQPVTDCNGNEAAASVTVSIPSQSHEPPPLSMSQTTKTYSSVHESLNRQSINAVPTSNENYAPPPVFDDDEDILPSSQFHLAMPSQNYEPPSFLPASLHTSLNASNSVPDSFGIRGSFPTRKRFVEECPMSMKCLRESYCQEMNPEEGNIDSFDIRVGGSTPSRVKCRQDNLPVDGVCCYLREDYSSFDITKPFTPDLDPVVKRVGAEDTCGMRRSTARHDSSPAGSTSFGEFPWQALLFIGSRYCGATILSRRTVLTSASCVRGVRPETIVVRVGEWDPGNAAEAKRHQDLKVDRVLHHPNYTGLTSDLAILFTRENITFDYHIGKICLPHPSSSYNGDSCISTGWGTATSRSFTSSGSLQSLRKSHVQFFSKQICEQQLRRHTLENIFKASKTSLCVNVAQRDVNTCSADDGGPIICEDAATGDYALVGVLTKVRPSATCGGLDTPLIYTSVPRLIQWLTDNLL